MEFLEQKSTQFDDASRNFIANPFYSYVYLFRIKIRMY